MSEPRRLRRVVLSLSDPVLRRDYLAHELARMPPERAAQFLDAVLIDNEAAAPEAAEVALSVACVVVAPENDRLVQRLRATASTLDLRSLERILRTAPPPSVHAPPPEEAPVPDYGAGRELSLGERRSLARRPDRQRFDQLLADPHPMVIRLLLDNPKAVEDDVVRLAARRPARHAALREIASSPKWLSRRRVRMAILLNPGSPPSIAIPLVCLCSRNQLGEVVESADASLVLRGTAQELLDRRPPVPEDPAAARLLQ